MNIQSRRTILGGALASAVCAIIPISLQGVEKDWLAGLPIERPTQYEKLLEKWKPVLDYTSDKVPEICDRIGSEMQRLHVALHLEEYEIHYKQFSNEKQLRLTIIPEVRRRMGPIMISDIIYHDPVVGPFAAIKLYSTYHQSLIAVPYDKKYRMDIICFNGYYPAYDTFEHMKAI